MALPKRPSLKDFHLLEPWKDKDYKKRFKAEIKSGGFGVGMINPKTKKAMYSAHEIDNLDEYYFCFRTAEFVCGWIEDCVTHTKPNRFKKFPLHHSQSSFFRNLFGWKRKADGMRRYMEAFKYIPRKNSKTFDIACLVHVGLLLDGEGSPEIYSVAKNKEQAKKIQEPFVGSIKNDQELPHLCTNGWFARTYSIHGKKEISAVTIDNETGVFKAIAADEGAAHGGNTHFGLCDEIHTWPNHDMFDVIQTSMGVRDQPLMVCLTTADYSRQSFCNSKLSEAKKVCHDPNHDDRFLPVLYYADPEEFGDDWEDVKVWERVNPMLGVALNFHILDRKFKQAKNENIYANAFKRLHLNICTKSEQSAFDITQFNKGLYLGDSQFELLKQAIPDFLLDARCYGGFDAAYKWDLSAFVLDFPDFDYVLCFNWIHSKHPEIVKYKNDYGNWLIVKGIEEQDFEKIAADMNEIYNTFDIVDVGFDPNQSREIIKILENDEQHPWECFTINQSPRHLSEPIKHTISSVESGKMNHNGNYLFSWQLSNADIKEDNHNNYMFVKPKGLDRKIKKIDAAVALAMARARRLVSEDSSSQHIRRKEESGSYFD